MWGDFFVENHAYFPQRADRVVDLG